jgi:flagellar assembly protein FliH
MSTIIKATGERHPSGPTNQPIAFQMDDMGKWYLDSVRKQAERILREANAEAAAIRAKAEQEGRQAALAAVGKAVEDKISAQLTTILPALQRSVDAIENSRQEWLAHWRRSAVNVAAAIAAKLIRRELSSQPAIALDLVAEALELASGSGEITLLMNPGDRERMGAQAEKLIGGLTRLGQAKIVADPAITPGGCRVQTQFGSIDQTFEAQLARIEEELG